MHSRRPTFQLEPCPRILLNSSRNKMDRESKLDHDSVVLETSMGDVQIELYYLHAPKVFIWSLTFRNLSDNASRHVKNFAELAKRGYYNGVIFHRVIQVIVSSRFTGLL